MDKTYETFLPEMIETVDELFDSDELNLDFRVVDKNFSKVNSFEDLIKVITEKGENVEPGRYLYRFDSKKEDICYILELFKFADHPASRTDILLYPEEYEPNLFKVLFETTDGDEYMLLFAGEF